MYPQCVDNYALNERFIRISGASTYSTVVFDVSCDALHDNGTQMTDIKNTNEGRKKCLLNGDTKCDSNKVEALMGISDGIVCLLCAFCTSSSSALAQQTSHSNRYCPAKAEASARANIAALMNKKQCHFFSNKC